MMGILFVGAGGFLGASTRYLLGLLPFSPTFPWITLLINFAGAVLIGIVSGLSEKYGLSPNMILFLKTGFCGGFTTFSAFSLETFRLFEKGSFFPGTLYIFFSVGLCLLGVYLGLRVTNF